MAPVPFVKMHGTGNDFVLIDGRDFDAAPLPEWARRFCDRRYGIGADGLLVAETSAIADVRYRMFNPDGSEAEMCGNGLRCFVAWFAGLSGQSSVRFEAMRVVDVADVSDLTHPLVPLDVVRRRNPPVIEIEGCGDGHSVSVGNPHVVIIVPDVDAVPLSTDGPRIERDPRFPEGTNVHFVSDLASPAPRVRHWERGAGETLACGSGSAAVAFVLRDIHDSTRHYWRLRLPGGEVTALFREDGTAILGGEVATVFTGEFPL